jgi:hypothetical protein
LKVAFCQVLTLWHAEHCPEKWLSGLSLVWQDAQSETLTAWWLKLASFHELTLWQVEHWPVKWLAGLFAEWQATQLVAFAT